MYFEILSNQSMRPSLLKHHLNTKHSMLVYLVRKLTEMRDTKEVISSFTDSTARAVEASLLESVRISGELLLSTPNDLVICMLNKLSVKCK